MRRLMLVLPVLALLPLTSADAAERTVVRAWVAERVSAAATAIEVNGGAGVNDHDYAMAAVASATVGRDGRLTGADGALFFGATIDSTPSVGTPGGSLHCEALPAAGTACSDMPAFGAIGFAVGWSDAAFNRVFVVVRGTDPSVALGRKVRGWELHRWYGRVRIARGDDADATTPVGFGAGAFTTAEAVGGPGGSVAIGHPPCKMAGYAAAGAGAIVLSGGTHDVVASCPADQVPPAAAAPGSTEWTLSGAVSGVSDVPARMVVIERPLPR
jgi:hypothetical protein